MTEETKLQQVTEIFSNRMIEKLQRKCKEGQQGWDRTGKHKWNNPNSYTFLKSELLRHVKKNDWIDVANFAMFLDYQERKTK